MKSYSLFLVILVISDSGSHCQLWSQAVSGQDYSLKLADSGRKVENTIALFMPEYEHEAIRSSKGEKMSVHAERLIVNGDTIKPGEITTRGKSTLSFTRKSLAFTLGSEARFLHGNKHQSMKRFHALSLSMDRDYCCNRLAFEMMEEAKMFGLFYTFCDLRINGRSEGIYMVIERPEDWALKKRDSPLVIRRGFNNEIDKIKTKGKAAREEINRYRDYFSMIYKAVGKYEGEELYNRLNEWIDTKDYMKWLAFNFFVRNGDYTDEVWFYVDNSIRKFRIIPWDYDDLFASFPHEGSAEYRTLPGNRLFFSTEDRLDKKIVNDPFLYNKYLDELHYILSTLSPDILKSTFETTYAELFPYYSDRDIISQSEYDLYKGADLKRLAGDLNAFYNQLLVYREICLRQIASDRDKATPPGISQK